MRRLTALVLLSTTALAVVTGCSNDTSGDPVTTTSSTTPGQPLTERAPDGARLCGFVPEESIRVLVGSPDFVTQGSVNRDSGKKVGGALCLVNAEDVDGPLQARVNVGFNLGFGRKDFDAGLENAAYDQLTPAVGLGYTYTDAGFGRTRIGHGDYLVQVDVRERPGRDAVEDSTALAQQVLQTLQLPTRWTIGDEPSPSR